MSTGAGCGDKETVKLCILLTRDNAIEPLLEPRDGPVNNQYGSEYRYT